ncbi:transketolase [Ferrimicrobium acidiphilum]|uniref:transketolase n=1 Tax=Ferrimicrobium acidiphilum TaxID=121039 RepID=UPI0023F2EE4B|nr:transketolase [Ferrimicrobium acidiphilum]
MTDQKHDFGGLRAPDVYDVASNALRFLAVDAVEQANSGHPGTPMAMAPVIYRLFTQVLRHDSKQPDWPDRDRFVLSGGHASMLLYGALHLSGYDLAIDDLKRFRRYPSRCPGHPERGMTPGVEVTTGPLGQGVANAVGLALAERMAADEFNVPEAAVVDHRTWVLCGDGDMMEGIASEASSLAGHLRLEKLTILYDSNAVTLDGPSSLSLDEEVATRYLAYGFRVLRITDVDDFDQVDATLLTAMQTKGQPTLVIMNSHIGMGSPFHDDHRAHGAALGAEAVLSTREQLQWPHPPFVVPDEAYAAWRPDRQSGYEEWVDCCQRASTADPERFAEYKRRVLDQVLGESAFEWPEYEDGASVSTRVALGAALRAAADRIPEIVGGAADVESSTETRLSTQITWPNYQGRDIYFGVREHAMAAITNGIGAHGGFLPFASTFFVFSDYLKPALRLSSIMELHTLFIFTHDSIALGEDGTTHQPVEQLAGLRAMPGIVVLRPADARETSASVAFALRRTEGPTVLVLSRQGLPVLAGTAEVSTDSLSGHRLRDGDDLTLVATGSEVSLALDAAKLLESQGIMTGVVSVPSLELLRARPAEEREALLGTAPRVALEAASSFGWYEFVDSVIGMNRFGGSGRKDEVLEAFGFTPEQVVGSVRAILGGK